MIVGKFLNIYNANFMDTFKVVWKVFIISKSSYIACETVILQLKEYYLKLFSKNFHCILEKFFVLFAMNFCHSFWKVLKDLEKNTKIL